VIIAGPASACSEHAIKVANALDLRVKFLENLPFFIAVMVNPWATAWLPCESHLLWVTIGQ
jgi:hypothetical protein